MSSVAVRVAEVTQWTDLLTFAWNRRVAFISPILHIGMRTMRFAWSHCIRTVPLLSPTYSIQFNQLGWGSKTDWIYTIQGDSKPLRQTLRVDRVNNKEHFLLNVFWSVVSKLPLILLIYFFFSRAYINVMRFCAPLFVCWHVCKNREELETILLQSWCLRYICLRLTFNEITWQYLFLAVICVESVQCNHQLKQSWTESTGRNG